MKKNTPKDSHYARLRRQYRDTKGFLFQSSTHPKLQKEKIYLYGIHPVRAALKNPRRILRHLYATPNALKRLNINESSLSCPITLCLPKKLEAFVGNEAVHQGLVLETETLKSHSLSELTNTDLIIVMDQITDPHNVGAIMRSAVAFKAGAIITTNRHSPQESGVLAKAASGALELIEYITVQNLSQALKELNQMNFISFGLDSEGELPLEIALTGNKISLVLGAESKGLRQKTRETVYKLARLDMPGDIKSLNVSNAATIALYAAHKYLRQ
ncbi:tRNA/rRNA metyltransferase [Bartonella clarridgeiae 73]|uniref:tRNA/rRNA metyltransferase n=1 Tax=Bartonella clarridgeiae (strain CCUG 45776 / CIP 104772 / 73) TaxID=696125 RepID=E6YI96_BARC7|nr:RNA methyltransferase [Bartonella clarridgeiae]WCR54846.1 MAG: 23S rRNA (guanosine(2251)-2'-O)-methyltransferase [Bartonella clarridgeiae]CBI76584.1 tRNA/rRNA metyltransferase [Bartonella clarridgeiae 73]